MKKFKTLTIIVFITVLLIVGFFIIQFFLTYNHKNEINRDYPSIKKEGVLRIVINTNPIDYFIFQGQPMGFQLEMFEEFAKSHDLSLEVIVENGSEKGISLLLSGKCDIMALPITNSLENNPEITFTLPVRHTKLVLVQRIPQDENKADTILIRNLSDLELKTVYTSKASNNKYTLNSHNSLSLRNYYLVEVDSMPEEQMIQQVSEGLIDYFICDYNIARIAQSYYSNIDIKTEISKTQDISWYVRNDSKLLLDSLNMWLEKFTKSEDYQKLKLKYINNNRLYVDLNSEFYSGNEGHISDYDELIKKYCVVIGWDWRLLGSLIYEESRFNPDIVSWAGAVGIMQLMPVIYEKHKSYDLEGIESQIYAGVNYIRFLYTTLSHTESDSANMVKFVIAAYNIGPGHIEDAMRLASKYKKNPGSWDNVSYYLINLSNPKYYNDTCVKHGYFPGIYSVNFTNSIVNRYKHYVNIIPE
ncbi:MAG TPA: transporter substrate-binding domain-containing protein [Bacteroidales bacterium]|nr:transporter substrate-binding domain-containing protein [Bacteroidales bacterium]